MFKKLYKKSRGNLCIRKIVHLISKPAFILKIVQWFFGGILCRIYMFHLLFEKKFSNRKEEEKEKEKGKISWFPDYRFFEHPSLIPSLPVLMMVHLNWNAIVSQWISLSAWITLLSIFSLHCWILLHYLVPYIYIRKGRQYGKSCYKDSFFNINFILKFCFFLFHLCL